MTTKISKLRGLMAIIALFAGLGCRQEMPHTDGLFPDGYIAITFDDESVSNWYRNLPLLDSLRIKATFYVSKYHTLNTEQKQKLKTIQSHGHEIAYHTTNHIDLRKTHENKGMDFIIKNEIMPDLSLMRADGFNPTDFAFPFGSHNVELDNELVKYFNSVRALGNKNNAAKALIFQSCKKQVFYGPDIDDSKQNWPDNAAIKKMIDLARDKRACVIFTAHQLNNSSCKLAVSADRLRLIAQWAQQNNMQFITVDKVSQ
jgi:peptidoglycan/xylan/chitin deacetylase (PgdA/CDA1 family)